MAGRYQGYHLFRDVDGEVGEALRCSGNTMAGFGDRVLKVVPLTTKELGRSPQARKRMKARENGNPIQKMTDSFEAQRDSYA